MSDTVLNVRVTFSGADQLSGQIRRQRQEIENATRAEMRREQVMMASQQVQTKGYTASTAALMATQVLATRVAVGGITQQLRAQQQLLQVQRQQVPVQQQMVKVQQERARTAAKLISEETKATPARLSTAAAIKEGGTFAQAANTARKNAEKALVTQAEEEMKAAKMASAIAAQRTKELQAGPGQKGINLQRALAESMIPDIAKAPHMERLGVAEATIKAQTERSLLVAEEGFEGPMDIAGRKGKPGVPGRKPIKLGDHGEVLEKLMRERMQLASEMAQTDREKLKIEAMSLDSIEAERAARSQVAMESQAAVNEAKRRSLIATQTGEADIRGVAAAEESAATRERYVDVQKRQAVAEARIARLRDPIQRGNERSLIRDEFKAQALGANAQTMQAQIEMRMLETPAFSRVAARVARAAETGRVRDATRVSVLAEERAAYLASERGRKGTSDIFSEEQNKARADAASRLSQAQAVASRLSDKGTPIGIGGRRHMEALQAAFAADQAEEINRLGTGSAAARAQLAHLQTPGGSAQEQQRLAAGQREITDTAKTQLQLAKEKSKFMASPEGQRSLKEEVKLNKELAGEQRKQRFNQFVAEKGKFAGGLSFMQEELGKFQVGLQQFAQTAQYAFAAGTAALGGFLSAASPSAMATFTESIKGVAIELGAGLIPYADLLSMHLQRIERWIRALSPELKDNAIRWGLVGLGIAGVVAVLPLAVSSFSALITVVKGAGIALSFLYAHPVIAGLALVAAGVTAIAAAWYLAAENTQKAGDQLRDLQNETASIQSGAATQLIGKLGPAEQPAVSALLARYTEPGANKEAINKQLRDIMQKAEDRLGAAINVQEADLPRHQQELAKAIQAVTERFQEFQKSAQTGGEQNDAIVLLQKELEARIKKSMEEMGLPADKYTKDVFKREFDFFAQAGSKLGMNQEAVAKLATLPDIVIAQYKKELEAARQLRAKGFAGMGQQDELQRAIRGLPQPSFVQAQQLSEKYILAMNRPEGEKDRANQLRQIELLDQAVGFLRKIADRPSEPRVPTFGFGGGGVIGSPDFP